MLKKLFTYLLLGLFLFQFWINTALWFSPSNISWGVFHFDLNNLDGDNNDATQPADNSKIQQLFDTANLHTTIQNNVQKQATFQSQGLNNKPALFFDGIDDIYAVDDSIDLASAENYDQKSFAIVFETSDDISSLQTLYEQGGKEKWYAIQIENWKLYAGVWNSVDWSVGDQFKIADLWNIEQNTVYNVILYQNSQTNNHFKVYLNGELKKSILSVWSQKTHGACVVSGSFDCYMFANGGSIGIGATKNDTLRLSDSIQQTWDEIHHFKWKIWELASWNNDLSNSEVQWLFGYFDTKWIIKKTSISIQSPAKIWVVPEWNSEIYITYNDFQNWAAINLASDNLQLYKWNGTSWWTDIASTYIYFSGKTMNQFEAKYPLLGITKWKYRLEFSIAKTNGDISTKIRDFYVWSLEPNELNNLLFHLDAQDINGDGNLTNNPNNNARVTTWTDAQNGFNAYQNTNNKKPRYKTNTINGKGSIEFDGSNDVFLIDNKSVLNTASSYTEKSFATVFKTGNDINTFQTIYEQWWTVRWYSFVVHNGNIYAWVWNKNEWDTGHKYKSVNLWPAQPNTVYFSIIVQDSKTLDDTKNTLSIYLNGNLSSQQIHVDKQIKHSGRIWLWAVRNDTVRASDNVGVSTTEGHYFGWNIWEMISWNYALDQADVNGVQEYFSQRWDVVTFSEKFPIPSPTSDSTPAYTFITNKSGSLSYGGSCSSIATVATVGENTINLSSDASWTPLSNGIYNDCIIILTDDLWFSHNLNITSFEVIATSYTLAEVVAIPTPNSNHFPSYSFSSPINWNIEFFGSCGSNDNYANIWNNTITLNYLPDGFYSNCYVRVNNWINQSEYLLISPFQISSSAPVFWTGTLSDNMLIPSKNFPLVINYTDDSGIETTSKNIVLQKYNPLSWLWGPDISPTDLIENSIGLESANLQWNFSTFWKYRLQFTIGNIHGTASTYEKIFYIDEVELNINTWNIDLWTLNTQNINFSNPVEIQVKTLWAKFDILMQENLIPVYKTEILPWYNGTEWFWHEKSPFNGSLQKISWIETIWTQSKNININWEKNTYSYFIRLWAIISPEQAAGNYNWEMRFGINLDY